MKIQINTDKNIAGSAAHNEWLQGTVETALARHSDRITRIELHLSDENAGKSGNDDKRCLLEARPEGLQPVAVTCQSATIDQAVLDALGKMGHLLNDLFDRKKDHRRPV